MPKIIHDGVNYMITSPKASNVAYSNEKSKMHSSNVQAAIDELATNGGREYVTLEEYKEIGNEALTDNKVYFVDEGQANPINAGSVNYNNSASTLDATNVNSAITELDDKVVELNDNLIKFHFIRTKITLNNSVATINLPYIKSTSAVIIQRMTPYANGYTFGVNTFDGKIEIKVAQGSDTISSGTFDLSIMIYE